MKIVSSTDIPNTFNELNKVFPVACLLNDSWKLFNEICEKGMLKNQHTLSMDLKGKPTFRPTYILCLLGLDVADRLVVFLWKGELASIR